MIKPNQTVLFQGDSITSAFRQPGEASDAFQLGSGYALMIASWLRAARPGAKLHFINRGVAGDKVFDLVRRWRPDCIDLRPDVLSILVGINDVCAGTPQDEFAARYCELLKLTRRELPDVRLVLIEPFVLPYGEVTRAHQQDIALRQQAVCQLACDFGAILVPAQAWFNKAIERAPADYWSYDGFHLTAAGFALLAELWIEIVDGGLVP